MKRLFTAILFLSVYFLDAGAQNIKMPAVISDAEKQTALLLENAAKIREKNPELVSPRTLVNDTLKMVSSRDWTSGFFPGVLWFLFEYTGKDEWKQAAMKHTALIEREKMNGVTHDMGFKIYCSFGAGLRLTNNSEYRDVIIQSAKTLSTRFRPITGTIRSWDHSQNKWAYPVIIDNMMNLELLFAATRLTGDSSFYRIAVTHANTTMKNHYRPDNSSFHVVEYDTLTGLVVKKTTHQGYSDASAWSRGQAWGLYGYTMCYRETKNPEYLKMAEKIAAYMLNHPNMPADLVPYWDYNAPGIPNEPRDVSAGAILASALLELGNYSKQKNRYRNAATKILQNLTRNYRSPIGANSGFILVQSTGSKPGNSEVNVPLNYADYYYLEALLRSADKKKSSK